MTLASLTVASVTVAVVVKSFSPVSLEIVLVCKRTENVSSSSVALL